MHLAEFVVFLILFAFIAWPSSLKRIATPLGKIIFIAVAIYLAHYHPLLGCVAAVAFIRIFQLIPNSTWRPPRADRIGMDTLLRPQESFFKPSVRIPGEPISEAHQPYTLF